MMKSTGKYLRNKYGTMRIESWRESMKRVLYSALRENNSWELKSILSWKPIVYHFGEEFAEMYMQERKDRNIFLYSLRLTWENYDTEKHKNYAWYLKEAQHSLSDEKIEFDWIFLWDDMVVWFHLDKEECHIFEWSREWENFNKLFEKYWNTK